MKRVCLFLTLFVFLFCECSTFCQESSTLNVPGQLSLAVPFSDYMVLQRDRAIPVWGSAVPGEVVSVSFVNQKKTTTTDSQGKWRLDLESMPAGGPFVMTVQGKVKTIVLKQVLVGDVWICSGQSNMGFVLKDATSFAEEKEPLDNVRLLRIGTQGTSKPVTTVKTRGWSPCSPKTAAYFSAVGYYFGKELNNVLNADGKRNIPVGLIDNSWGGATCEAYIDATRLKADPTLIGLFDAKRVQALPTQKRPSFLYNGMLYPMIPYAIKGVIWYQGEANAVNGRGQEYAKLFPMMIQNWRDSWRQGDFPFYFVQLPNFREPQKTPNDSSEWAILRQSQASGLTLPKTEQAITLELGDPKDIHPRNKKDVGYRLAKIALALDYGISGEYTGPRPTSLIVEGKTALVTFNHVGTGLIARGDSLQGFAIAGPDGIFHWADATIQGNRVRLSAEKVTKPVIVRYAWADNPIGNLYNREGFPAGTFELKEIQR